MSRVVFDAETKAKLKRDGWARIVLPMLPEYCTVLCYEYKECPELWHQLDWSYSYSDHGPNAFHEENSAYLHIRAWIGIEDDAAYRVRCFYEIGEYIGGMKRGAKVTSIELARDTFGEEWLWILRIERPKETA